MKDILWFFPMIMDPIHGEEKLVEEKITIIPEYQTIGKFIIIYIILNYWK